MIRKLAIGLATTLALGVLGLWMLWRADRPEPAIAVTIDAPATPQQIERGRYLARAR